VDSYKKMVKNVVEEYPNVEIVGTTLREVVSGLINNWSALFYYEGDFYHSLKFEKLELEDRVGGGDGFCSGIVYGFLNSMKPQEIVDFGATHGALLQSTRGDTSQITLEEVMHVMKGGSARIKR
jgi:2-dehydro-3-deoxygluconokinase